MLDPRMIRENSEEIKVACRLRGYSLDETVDALLAVEAEHRALLSQAEALRIRQNETRREILTAEPMLDALRSLACSIDEIDVRKAAAWTRLQCLAMTLPNLPAVGLPTERTLLRSFGSPRRFPYAPKRCRNLLTDLKLASGDGPVLCGAGARIERAVVNFLLDRLAGVGYVECSPAVFSGEEGALFWGHRGELLDAARLPLCHSGHRADLIDSKNVWPVRAGKVELFGIALPGNGEQEYSRLLSDVEAALSALDLPLQTVLLPATELPFSAAWASSVEVWMPAAQKYRVVCTVENRADFEARRNACRCKREGERKARPVESVGGSLSLAGVVLAILENNQNGDGSVSVPEALRPVMGAARITR